MRHETVSDEADGSGPGPDPGASRFAPLGFAAEGVYLNTATSGVPPAASAAAMADCVDAWRRGRLDPLRFDDDVAACRSRFAQLVGVPPAWVATGSQVSAFVGVVAASLPADAEVLCAEEDFTSVLFPFLAQVPRGVTVRTVPLDELAGAVRASTTLVAVSLVQSADGRFVDLDAVVAAARAAGAATLLDVTQAAGWVDIDGTQVDYLVCGAYKWLLSPRGTAFFAVAPARWDQLVPHLAGWYAGDDTWASIYGPPLRLALDARRFDLSPAWLCWAGARPSLEALVTLGPAVVAAHDLTLADRFRAAMDLDPSLSAIVSVGMDYARDRLEAAGVVASQRAGRVRLSFHLHNTAADVDVAVRALAGAGWD